MSLCKHARILCVMQMFFSAYFKSEAVHPPYFNLSFFPCFYSSYPLSDLIATPFSHRLSTWNPSLHLCPEGVLLRSHLMCRNVSSVWGSHGGGCGSVASLVPWRLTHRQSQRRGEKSLPALLLMAWYTAPGNSTALSFHRFLCLAHNFSFSLFFFFRTSTRMGENRWSSVRGLLCWVSVQYVKPSNSPIEMYRQEEEEMYFLQLKIDNSPLPHSWPYCK